MITGVRKETDVAAYRPGHRFGNRLLTGLVRWIFSAHVGDMLSGYRVMSHRFVKSFPTQTMGFGLETEMTVHALQLLMPTDEVVDRTTRNGRRTRSEQTATRIATAGGS